MLKEIYSGSFEYSFKNKKAITSIIKVGILLLLSFLIIPLILFFGFSYRVILIGLTGSISYTNDPMPKFNYLGEIFIQGLKVFFVGVIYFLPVIAILAIGFCSGIADVHFYNLSNFSINFDFSLSFFILLLLVFLSFLFTSVAIPHMVNNNGSISYAFKIKDLIKLIKYTSIVNYIYFFIISIIFLIVLILISFILSQFLISLIGIIFIAIYSFDLSDTIYGCLNVGMFLLFFIFSMGLFTIIESRVISFMYNDDGLEEE